MNKKVKLNVLLLVAFGAIACNQGFSSASNQSKVTKYCNSACRNSSVLTDN